jgi:hypothetical protein
MGAQSPGGQGFRSSVCRRYGTSNGHFRGCAAGWAQRGIALASELVCSARLGWENVTLAGPATMGSDGWGKRRDWRDGRAAEEGAIAWLGGAIWVCWLMILLKATPWPPAVVLPRAWYGTAGYGKVISIIIIIIIIIIVALRIIARNLCALFFLLFPLVHADGS